jgi:hypothetical protein
MLAWGVGWTGGALTSGLPGQLVGVRTAMITLTALGAADAAVAWLSPLRAAQHMPNGRTATHPEFSVDSALAGSD